MKSQSITLVVEDNLVNQQVMGLFLQQLNLQVDFAANGQEAISSIHNRDYVIVFMDIEMPLMDGIEAVHRIRTQPDLVRQPYIVALTAHQDDLLDFYKKKGFDALLVKPVTLQMIQSVFALYLAGKTQEKSDKLQQDLSATMPFDPDILNQMKENLGEESNSKLYGIVNTFIEYTPELLNNMVKAVECADWETVRRNAHTLKSSSASMGVIHLSNQSASLENKLCSRLGETINQNQASELLAEIKANLEDIYQSYDEACANLIKYQTSLGENS